MQNCPGEGKDLKSAINRMFLIAEQIGNAELISALSGLNEKIKKKKKQFRFECTWDPRTLTRLSVNNDYCVAFGLSASDLIGKSIFSMTTDEDMQSVRDHVRTLLGSKLAMVSTERVAVNGRRAVIRWCDRPVLNNDCTIARVDSVGQIVCQASPEYQVANAPEFCGPKFFCTIGRDMRIKHLSKNYLDYFKLDGQLCVPVYDYPLIPPEDRKRICEVLDNCFSKKVEVVLSNQSYSDITKSSIIKTRWRNIPVFDDRGRPQELACIGEVMQIFA